MTPTERGPGRPPIGPRLHICMPSGMLTLLDEAARRAGRTRAEEVRRRLSESLRAAAQDGKA